MWKVEIIGFGMGRMDLKGMECSREPVEGVCGRWFYAASGVRGMSVARPAEICRGDEDDGEAGEGGGP